MCLRPASSLPERRVVSAVDLRRKLEKEHPGGHVFETEAGVGYRLVWDGA